MSIDGLSALDGGNGNVPVKDKKTESLRMSILATMIALGLWAHLSNAIPTETRAKDAANKAAQIAQDGGGY